MIDRDTLRKMCEYPITPSLVSEAIDYFVVKETARQRADRIWRMNDEETQRRD
jgi:hypothetical protein